MHCLVSRAAAVSTRKCDPSLQVLTPQIAKCTETLSAQDIGNALYGLHGLNTELAIPVLHTVFPKSVDEALLSTLSTRSDTDLVAFTHGAVSWLVRKGEALAISEELKRRLLRFYRAASHELAGRTTSTDGVGRAEARYRQCALMAFKDRQDVEVKPTSCYLHGFKADIVISVAVKDSAPAILNVEIDGPHHRHITRRRFHAIRDEHMTSCGVRIFRWDLMKPDGSSPDAFTRWLRDVVAATVGDASKRSVRPELSAFRDACGLADGGGSRRPRRPRAAAAARRQAQGRRRSTQTRREKWRGRRRTRASTGGGGARGHGGAQADYRGHAQGVPRPRGPPRSGTRPELLERVKAHVLANTEAAEGGPQGAPASASGGSAAAAPGPVKRGRAK